MVPCLRATSATLTPGTMLSAAIHARSTFVRSRRPLGPSITSSRETPAPLEPSKWTPIFPALSKIQTLRHVHACRMAGSGQKWQEGVGVALTTAYDKRRYKRRNRIEIMFGRLKDWRRVATRYDRCPKVFLSAIALAATVI